MLNLRLLLTFLVLFCSAVSASVPLRLSDKELAQKTDHVFVAHVVAVDMIDGRGRTITDGNASTGPLLGNTIRLKVHIDEILVTNADKVPEFMHIPLDSFMHYSLSQVKEAHAGEDPPFLLLLSGERFAPSAAGVFRRDLERKAWFVRRVRAKHKAATKGS